MIGKILGDRYEILREIGNGGMARVYAAKCRLLNRTVAIKILRPEYANDVEFLNRFYTEAQAAAGLSHPNIVGIFDFGKADGLPYIVMEYVEGETLKKFIEKNVMLPWRQSVNYAIQICKALECAHKNNIVHRDIKPHNIIMTPDGILKVTDFGIARATSAQTATLDTDTTMGSVHYFSPEQARGGYTDEKSDIYSLGVVMYEMLTGKLPFDGDNSVAIAIMHIQKKPVPPKELNISIPLAVDAIVLKAMSKERASRYQSATEMLEDLKAVLVNPNEIISSPQDNSVPSETIVISTNEVKNGINRKEPEREFKPDMKKNDDHANKKAVIWAIVTSIIIVGLMIFGVLAVLNPNFFHKETVPVPDLVGRSYDDMVQEYQDKGLTLKIVREVTDSDYDEGVIVEQSPKAGKSVKTPFTINVVVSSSGESITLKNYTKIQVENVKKDLSKLGLKSDVKEEPDDTIPKGLVIKTLPVGGSTVSKGDSITLYVSSGPEDVSFEMPDLTGESLAQAKRILAQHNLREGNITYEPSGKPKDEIIYQSIAAGEVVQEYTTVDLVASSGNDTTQPSGQNSKTITIQVPQDNDSTTIKVVQDGVTIHNAVHSKTEKAFDLTITGKGPSVLEIYYNGVKSNTTTVNL